MALKFVIPGLSLAVSGREYDSVEELHRSVRICHASSVRRYMEGYVELKEGDTLQKYPIYLKVYDLDKKKDCTTLIQVRHSLVSLLERPALNAILAKGWYPNRTLTKVQAYPFKGRYLLSTGEFSDRANLPYVGSSEFDSAVFYRGKWRPCQTEGDEIIMVSISHNPVTKQPKRYPKDKFDVREF